jgi:hypothetical protein
MTDPTQHPKFGDVAKWLTVPGRTFMLHGVVYKVVEDEPQPDLLPAAFGVIVQLLDYEQPGLNEDGEGDPFWYILDDDCAPTYKGREITDAERAVLDRVWALMKDRHV